MSKLLVLYYSSWGHVETLAKSIAEGAREVDGVEVTIKRVPELMPEKVARDAGVKLDQDAPIAEPKELAMARFQGRHVARIAHKLHSP